MALGREAVIGGCWSVLGIKRARIHKPARVKSKNNDGRGRIEEMEEGWRAEGVGAVAPSLVDLFAVDSGKNGDRHSSCIC